MHGHLVGSHEHFAELARKRAEETHAKKLISSEEFDKLSPEELDAAIRAQDHVHSSNEDEEFLQTQQEKDAREAGLSGQTLDDVLRIQRDYAESGRFASTEDRNLISSLPRDQQRAWRAGVRQHRNWKTKTRDVEYTSVETDPETGRLVDVRKKMDQTDYNYMQDQDKDRIIRKRLAELVNPNPSKKGKQDAKTSAQVASASLLRELDLPEDSARDQAAEITRLEGRIAKLQKVAATRPDVEQKAYQDTINRAKAERDQVRRPARDRLVEAIHASHTAGTPEERAAAAEEAHRLIGRAAISEGARWREAKDTREMERDRAALQGPLDVVHRVERAREKGEPESLGDRIKWHYTQQRIAGNVGDFEKSEHHRVAIEELESAERRTRIAKSPRTHLPDDPRDLRDVNDYFESSLSKVNRRRIGKGKDPLPDDSRRADWAVQGQFLADQKRNQITAWKHGTVALGRTEDGAPAPLVPKGGGKQGNMHKVAWGLAPNQEYEYTVRQEGLTPEGRAKPNITKRVEMFDRNTKFKTGRRDQFGALYPDEQDEIVSVAKKTKFREPVHYSQGKRTLKNNFERREIERDARDHNIDEVVYLPLTGAKGESTTVPHPTETKSIYTVRTTTGQTKDVSKSEWDNTDKDYRNPLIPVPKQVKYIFHDPDKLKMAPGESDQLSIQFGKTVDPENPSAQVASRRIITNLAQDTTRDNVFGRYLRAKNEIHFEKKARKAHDVKTNMDTQRAVLEAVGMSTMEMGNRENIADREAKKAGFSGAKELQMFAEAATIAGLYRARRNVKEGYLPQAVNTIADKARKRSSKLDTWLTEHHDLEDQIMTVNRAYVRPAHERVHELGYMVQHPLSSPEGNSFGVDWGRWRYTNPWMGRDKREGRRFERYERSLDRVVRNRESIRRHRNDTGVLGAIRNWRVEPMLRHPDYANFHRPDGLLQRTTDIAQAYQDHDRVSFVDAITGQRVEHINEKTHLREGMQVTPKMRSHASKFLERAEEIAGRDGRGIIPPRTVEGLGMHFNPKNPFVIAGALAGTALAADYAVFKYKQHKLLPEDRKSYINHILPPAFHVPVPSVHTTGWVRTPENAFTREFAIDNKRVPVRWGASLDKHKIALRPMDNGYEKNLPLFGNLRSAKTKGGSLTDSLVFNQREFRRNRRAGTHDVFIKGKKVPLEFTIGNRAPIKKSGTNPNRLTNEMREDIVWAYQGRPDHEVDQVKSFYGFGKRDDIVDMFDDPDVLARAEKRHGKKQEQQYHRQFFTTIKRTERQWRESRP